MPTYDYRCNECGHEFELFQSMSDSVKRKCPQCGKLKLERLIGTGAAVIFKGDGFYQTDYRSESYKKAASADAKNANDSKGSDSKSESKSESKPGIKPGTKSGAQSDTKVHANPSKASTPSSGNAAPSPPAKKKPNS